MMGKDMEEIWIEKRDGRIVKIESCGFEWLVFFGKEKKGEMVRGKLFGIVIVIFEKVRKIVFIGSDGRMFEVRDFGGLVKVL